MLAVLEDDIDYPVGNNDVMLDSTEDAALPSRKLRIVPTTRVSFVDRQYRFVYCIDMSPSMAVVVCNNFFFNSLISKLKLTFFHTRINYMIKD